MNKLTMLPNELNVDKIKYSEMKSLDSGAKIMYVNYGDSGNIIYVQTPEMQLQFDASFFAESGSSDSGKYSCKVSFSGKENNDKLNNMFTMLSNFDKKLINDAHSNSKKWFNGKNLSKEALEQLYTPMVKFSLDSETGEISDKYPPGFQFKVVKRNGKSLCKFYDSSRELVNTNDHDKPNYTELDDILKKNTSMSILLQCNGLWFAGGKFGCTWKAIQIKSNKLETIENYAFRDDESDDDVICSDSDKE